jgi:hypothetical protein
MWSITRNNNDNNNNKNNNNNNKKVLNESKCNCSCYDLKGAYLNISLGPQREAGR